jgi:hypothetical protein
MTLTTRDRAFAVAAARLLPTRAELLCQRRSGDLRRYAARLVRDPTLREREAARLDAPVPAGLGAIHPSWYQRPGDEAPPASRDPAAAAHLERRAYGHLVAMWDSDERDGSAPRDGARESPPLIDRLEREDPLTLVTLLTALGRRRVAIAFSGAPRAALAQLCARLGEPTASEILQLVRQVASQIASDEVRASQRALFQLGLADLQGTDAARALFVRAGAGWIGPALAQRGGDRLRRVAQRLPRDVGEVLLEGGARPATESEVAQAVAAAAMMLPGAL